jgi:hypothetical protein
MRAKLTIEEMHALAKVRGGVCLSMEYGSSIRKLQWRCSEGHEWEHTPNQVQQGNWCSTCGNKRGTIEKYQALAKAHGGVCLSPEYVDARTKLRWGCLNGHKWKAKPTYMQRRANRGRWCTQCPRVT